MVKIGDTVEFTTESGRKTTAKVILVQEQAEKKPILTVQFKTDEGFQREIGSICHDSERSTSADGKKLNCYGNTTEEPVEETPVEPEVPEETPPSTEEAPLEETPPLEEEAPLEETPPSADSTTEANSDESAEPPAE